MHLSRTCKVLNMSYHLPSCHPNPSCNLTLISCKTQEA